VYLESLVLKLFAFIHNWKKGHRTYSFPKYVVEAMRQERLDTVDIYPGVRTEEALNYMQSASVGLGIEHRNVVNTCISGLELTYFWWTDEAYRGGDEVISECRRVDEAREE